MWQLFWSESARKDLQKLDQHIAKMIINKTSSVLDNSYNPIDALTPLKYAKQRQYKYRIGKYRVICILEESKCHVVAISIGHRKDIHKR